MSKKLAVLDTKGKSVGEIKIDDNIANFKVNPALIHQVIRAHLAQQRAGTASTKTRAEVRGGGAKPWRQKGTGRARAGSIRSPLWKGGGVVFGPTPRSFSIKIPKKAKKQALKAALADKLRQGKVLVVDKFNWKEARTKKAVEVLNALGAQGKILAIFKDEDENIIKSFRNLPEVKITHLAQLNTYDILDSDSLLTSQDTFKTILEERFNERS